MVGIICLPPLTSWTRVLPSSSWSMFTHEGDALLAQELLGAAAIEAPGGAKYGDVRFLHRSVSFGSKGYPVQSIKMQIPPVRCPLDRRQADAKSLPRAFRQVPL